MKTQTLLLSLLGAASVGAARSLPIKIRADDRGSYEVSGLGSRKQEILNAGGSSLDIAIAMLESDTMEADYAYGQFTSGDFFESLTKLTRDWQATTSLATPPILAFSSKTGACFASAQRSFKARALILSTMVPH